MMKDQFIDYLNVKELNEPATKVSVFELVSEDDETITFVVKESDEDILENFHDIQNRLRARVNEILGECENDVDVLHEEQPHIVLNLARDRNLARMNRVDVMINEIRDIRMSVSRLNQMVGINDLLANHLRRRALKPTYQQSRTD